MGLKLQNRLHCVEVRANLICTRVRFPPSPQNAQNPALAGFFAFHAVGNRKTEARVRGTKKRRVGVEST